MGRVDQSMRVRGSPGEPVRRIDAEALADSAMSCQGVLAPRMADGVTTPARRSNFQANGLYLHRLLTLAVDSARPRMVHGSPDACTIRGLAATSHRRPCKNLVWPRNGAAVPRHSA